MSAENEQRTDEHADRHRSAQEFSDYYAARHESAEMIARFEVVKDKTLSFVARHCSGTPSRVLDVGCGPGAQSMVWAAAGYQVSALDINGPLIENARSKAESRGLSIDFRLGTADALPWPDDSFDVVLVPELLEHVANWRQVLAEVARVTAPGGVIFLSTTNALCPRQEEFSLPLYSWYPGPLKRYCEKLAVTTRPQLANYASYPAVNWFTPYGLGRACRALGIQAFDRFDVLDVGAASTMKRIVARLCRALPPLRFLGHCFTSGTLIFGLKQAT